MKRPGLCFGCCLLLGSLCTAGNSVPTISRISPTSGPEGTRVEIDGSNLERTTKVVFGVNRAQYKVISTEKVVAIAPHRSGTSFITVDTPTGRTSSRISFIVQNDPRIPEEVSYKAGYVNDPPPQDFHSAMLWGIAISDMRVKGYKNATVEVAWLQLSCRINGTNQILNEDHAAVRGGLYQESPWFDQNHSDPMPIDQKPSEAAVILHVGHRPDRIWHFWSASPRQLLPEGRLQGCTARARVKISRGALFQIGMDYWRNPTIGFDHGGNNHEAGVSNWYFPSDQWQEAVFTDVGGVQF